MNIKNKEKEGLYIVDQFANISKYRPKWIQYTRTLIVELKKKKEKVLLKKRKTYDIAYKSVQ